MKVSRLIASIAILGSGALALTACDPPMPPEVAAAIAEQTYTCVEGNATVSSPSLMTDIVVGWADSLSYSCVDDPATSDVVEQATMTFSVADAATSSADAEISEYPALCSPVQTVPLAVEAGVLVYMESDLSSFSVSPKNLAGILNGTITNWSQLASDNPGTEMPSLPLKVAPTADTMALKSITDYLTAQGQNLSSSVVTGADNPSVDLYSALEEGEVAIVPNSYAVYLGLYPASIYLGMDKETESPILATPDLAGIYAGSTQWKIEKDTNSISLSLDPSKTPEPAPGFDSAPPPYQAIYPVNYYTCNSSGLVLNAIGRFILRLDSQGSIGASNYAQLPEYIRIESLLMISKGLPTPTPTPTE
ncbi:MAG: hypothetical protein EBT65_06430 [Actinobacteria bacterium]|nr:hypothetical protein [Actinomycetota bacterium]